MTKGKENFTLKELQNKVDDYIKQFEEGYWPPLSMFAALVEETGEIARLLNALEGIKPKKISEKKQLLKEEIGDLLFALVCLANHYNIDLSNSLISSLEKYSKRDTNRWTKKN